MSGIDRKLGRPNSRWHPEMRISPVLRYPGTEQPILDKIRERAGFHNGAKVFVRPMNKDVGLIAGRIRLAKKLGVAA